MTDTALAKRWLKTVAADAVIPGKKRRNKIALNLLRGWRSYQKSGLCPWTKEVLYDYTFFLHAFAQRYGGENNELYQWLRDKGIKMLDILNGTKERKLCWACGAIINSGDTEGSTTLCSICADSALMRRIGS